MLFSVTRFQFFRICVTETKSFALSALDFGCELKRSHDASSFR
jgi:hypothetical protein